MSYWRALLLLLLVGPAHAVIPEGSVERCTASNQTATAAQTITTKADTLYVITEGTVTGGSVVAFRYGPVTSLRCHPGAAGWTQTVLPAYGTAAGTFTGYEVGFLQEAAGASAWGASKAIQVMGWFLAPMVFGIGFLVGVKS